MPLPHRCWLEITTVNRKVFLRFERRVTPRWTIGEKAGPVARLNLTGFDFGSGVERPRRHLANQIKDDRFRVAPTEICDRALAGLGRLILSHVSVG